MSDTKKILPLPISIQLHTLRDEMAKSPQSTLERIAQIGFKFVEPANLFSIPPSLFRTMVEDLGMKIGTSHSPWATNLCLQETIETAGELGITQVVAGFMEDSFQDLDAIRQTADKLNTLQSDLASAGLKLFLHNHWWEFAPLGDRLVIDHLLEHCPNLKLELDLYWAAHFGDQDVPSLMRRLKDRIIQLHVKDGDFNRERGAPLLALGDGKMDLAACLAEADTEQVGYYIFEMDKCATDVWKATEQSFRYLQDLTTTPLQHTTL